MMKRARDEGGVGGDDGGEANLFELASHIQDELGATAQAVAGGGSAEEDLPDELLGLIGVAAKQGAAATAAGPVQSHTQGAGHDTRRSRGKGKGKGKGKGGGSRHRHQQGQYSDPAATQRLSAELLEQRQRRQQDAKTNTNSAWGAICKIRAGLPAAEERGRILECVRDNQVVLVSGATGCGKSTQVHTHRPTG